MSTSEIPTDATIRLQARRREEQQAVEEAGGGQAEGFEQAESALIDNATHGTMAGTARITRDARTGEQAAAPPDPSVYADADSAGGGD